MFEKLRNAFREAVDNFYEELNRDDVPEAVDRLLKGMRDELADAKLEIRDLEKQVETARAQAEREKREAATARRRGTMAEEIGDGETAKVAREFAAKHAERRRLLEEKAAALDKERAFRAREYDEMVARVKEAESKRDALAATTGRTGARESMGAADDLFAELDRMAEKIGGEEARARAAESMGDLDLDDEAASDFDRELGSDPPPPDVDRRLEELKRRMGRD